MAAQAAAKPYCAAMRKKLHAVAAYLLEHETMNAEEFEQVFASQAEPKQTGGEEKA